MKKTRRIAAFIAAMAMAATMAAPTFMMSASAAAQDITVTVDTTNDTETHTYKAYEIFKGEYDSTNKTFNVTDLGVGVKWNSTDGLLKADSDFMGFKATDNGKTMAEVIGSETDTKEQAKKLALALSEITRDSDKAKELAKIFGAAVTGDGTSLTAKGADGDASTLKEGYYVITDDYTQTTTAGQEKTDAKSRFILKVSTAEATDKKIEITTKKSYPTVIKKVKEDSTKGNRTFAAGDTTPTAIQTAVGTDAGWNDVADYSVGEAVPFKLFGTMPETLGDYAHYYYKFTDTLTNQFDQPTSVTITIGEKSLTAALNAGKTAYTVTGDTGTNCRVTYADNVLTVSFEDIKAYDGVDKDTLVVIEYSAVLNKNAVIGLDGQENKVKLTYSNNPNFEYTPNTDDEKEDTPKDEEDEEQTDETPEDKVIVFTYEADFDKVDSINTATKLDGATFVLYRTVTEDSATVTYVATGFDTTTKTVTEWTKATWDTTNKKYMSVVAAGETATEVTPYAFTTGENSDNNSNYQKIVIKGLDDNNTSAVGERYFLKETVAPKGYNLLTEDVEFTITGNTQNTQAWSGTPSAALTKIDNATDTKGYVSLATKVGNGTAAVTYSSTNSSDETKTDAPIGTITNAKGATLPSTGGMGTVLFYTVGGVLVIGAGVVLVTKKRMGKED